MRGSNPTLLIDISEYRVYEAQLLRLAIEGRYPGEKIAFWIEEAEKLFVLFDGRSWSSWRDYVPGSDIIPGVSLIFDATRPSVTGANIAGITMTGINHSLSYFYKNHYKSSYLKEAKRINRERMTFALQDLFDLMYQMNFTWYHEAENIKAVMVLYEGYADIVQQGIKDIRVHIPLITDLDELTSFH
jgi:hypothetical protein